MYMYLSHHSNTASNHSSFGLCTTHSTQTWRNKDLQQHYWILEDAAIIIQYSNNVTAKSHYYEQKRDSQPKSLST